MKKLESLGRSLSKAEQKKIMGGLEDPNEGAPTCCDSTSDCPDRTGWSKACSTTVVCGSNRHKCFWSKVIVE